MFKQIINAMNSSVWAIQPEKMEIIMKFLSIRLTGQKISDETISAVTQSQPEMFSQKKTVVLPIFGTITQHADMMSEYSGGTSTDKLGAMFDNAMSNPSIKSIILNIDSPGGSVYGLEELTTKIRNARGKGKRIIAVANSLMASAAYYIGSAADKIVASPGAQVGSIGTIAVHIDQSKAIEEAGYKYTFFTAGKYKALGNNTEPLSEDAVDYYQTMVDRYYDMFVSAVAQNRGISKQDVKSNYGQGKVLIAQDAVKVGMVDQIRTLEEVIKQEERRYSRTR